MGCALISQASRDGDRRPVPKRVEEAGDSAVKESLTGPHSPSGTLRILEIIAARREGVSLAHLSRRLAIPRASIFNRVRPLVAREHRPLCCAAPTLSAPGVALGALAMGAPESHAIAAKEASIAMIRKMARNASVELAGGCMVREQDDSGDSNA